MIMNMRGFILLLLTTLVLLACEEEFVPETNNASPEIVVEGYIEGGDSPTSPYVILTRSVPFFNEINLNQVDGFFVRDAEITVSTDDTSVELEEFCLDELEPAQRALAAELFGFDLDSTEIDFCVYIDPTFSMLGEEGKRYDLEINVEGKTLSSSTTLPEAANISNYTFFDTPGEPSDTLRELRIVLDDQPAVSNYYRYFTNINQTGYIAAISSVFNDLFFDGDEFELPLPKAEAGGVEFDLESYGFYHVGDTVDIKFCTIDEAHFDFWSTLEFNRANQGPFSSYTAISFNIEGGIGIWGGYTVTNNRMIVD